MGHISVDTTVGAFKEMARTHKLADGQQITVTFKETPAPDVAAADMAVQAKGSVGRFLALAGTGARMAAPRIMDDIDADIREMRDGHRESRRLRHVHYQ